MKTSGSAPALAALASPSAVGNYAASLLGEYTGIDHGCEQVCFVDAATKTYLEELGGMNMMVVHKDGHVETPSLTGNILPGVTPPLP